MKISVVRLVVESTLYIASRPLLWGVMGAGTIGFFGLSVMYDGVVLAWPGIEYLYVFLQTLFTLWWYLLITQLIMCDVGGQGCVFRGLIQRSLVVTSSAWWILAWQTLLAWASIPLLKTPYSYSESVDLLAYCSVTLLVWFQMVLNTFLLPDIVAGTVGIRVLYGRAVDFVIRWRWVLLRLSLVFAGIAVLMMFFFGFLVSLMRTWLECVVTCGWGALLARDLVSSAAFAVVMMGTLVASVMLYKRDQP